MNLSKQIEFKEKLKKTTSVKGMTDLLNEYYDTDKDLGKIAKGILFNWIDRVIAGSGLKMK